MSLFKSLSSCIGRPSSQHRRSANTRIQTRTQLHVEGLEARDVPSAIYVDHGYLDLDKYEFTPSGDEQVVRSQTPDSIAVSAGVEPVQMIEFNSVYVSSQYLCGSCGI